MAPQAMPSTGVAASAAVWAFALATQLWSEQNPWATYRISPCMSSLLALFNGHSALAFALALVLALALALS